MKGPTDRAMLTGAEPQIYVSDIRASCDFFTRTLGFKVRFMYGEPPHYAQVVRDHARLDLRQVDAPMIDRALQAGEQLLSAVITLDHVEDIRALFDEYRQAGAPTHQEPRSEPWGAITFIVKDLDGNLLLFAGPAQAGL